MIHFQGLSTLEQNWTCLDCYTFTWKVTLEYWCR